MGRYMFLHTQKCGAANLIVVCNEGFSAVHVVSVAVSIQRIAHPPTTRELGVTGAARLGPPREA